MSGPKSTSYTVSDALAQVNEAARQLQRELEKRERERQRELLRKEEEKRRARERERERREAEARARAEEARRREEARLAQLANAREARRKLVTMQARLAEALQGMPSDAAKPTLPAVPEIEDETVGGLSALEARYAELESRFKQIGDYVNLSRVIDSINLSAFGAANSIGDMLDQFVQANKEVSSQQAQSSRAESNRVAVNRIISRLRDMPLSELSSSFESLLQRAINAGNPAQFDMLCAQLQLQVQTHNERVQKRERDSKTAQEWLGQIEKEDVEGSFADLREALADVVAARRPWDAELVQDCEAATAELARQAQSRRDARAAMVLEATLKDLGYAVEGIGDTLFAEGGVVHFQGKGWNDHFMRLQVRPERGEMYFRMVCSADADVTPAADTEMERRWCAGYPELLKTLSERGIESTTLRALAPGQIVVEKVPADTLPRRSAHKSGQRAADAPRQLDVPLKGKP